MEISERNLRDVFLPSWVVGIKTEGALGVMATYPAIDGVPKHSSDKILTKILRDELGFRGLGVASLDLPGLQEDLIKAVQSTGTPTIVSLR